MSSDPHQSAETALELLAVPAAAHSRGAFTEPWARRVRDVDEPTLSSLLRTLVGMRRLRLVVGIGTACAGALLFGFLPIDSVKQMLLIYGTLAATVGLPVAAVSSLAVRRLFLKEANRNGVSRSASMLILTRAQRRARLLLPFSSTETQVMALMQAVRDPDTA